MQLRYDIAEVYIAVLYQLQNCYAPNLLNILIQTLAFAWVRLHSDITAASVQFYLYAAKLQQQLP